MTDRQPGTTVWLTGLSGTGKSTISEILIERFHAARIPFEVLDGDVVRTHLSKGLGFSREDRDINIRRIGWVCEVLNRHGVHVIVAAISPFRETRDEVRAQLPNFVEVFVTASLDALVARDPKGLYKKALTGEIKNFTGVSDPYEPPLNPEITCQTDSGETPQTSATRILTYLTEQNLIRT